MENSVLDALKGIIFLFFDRLPYLPALIPVQSERCFFLFPLFLKYLDLLLDIQGEEIGSYVLRLSAYSEDSYLEIILRTS